MGRKKTIQRIAATQLSSKYLLILNELAFQALSEAWRGDATHAQVQNFRLGLATGHPLP